MTQISQPNSLHGEALARAADQAVRAIPPAWPLTATVAVNPFVGQTGETLEQTAARLARISGVRLALPRRQMAAKIAAGDMTDADLLDALATYPEAGTLDLAALKDALTREAAPVSALPTVADLAARATNKDWPGLVTERIGTFAAGFFDEGQALWAASRRNGLYAAWRAFATHDLTPEILGLKGFGSHVADTPETPEGMIERAAVSLGLGATPGTYFHQLLLGLGGWAQFSRHIQFTAEIAGRSDTTALELLAIRLVFEEALLKQHRAVIDADWQQVRRRHTAPLAADPDMIIDGVLQLAAERAAQRKLAATLAAPVPARAAPQRPLLQAAFCIDVRSEVFRRALESVDPGIRTLGFAGFFGLGTQHKAFASDIAEHRLPVLLKPSVFSCSEVEKGDEADRQARFGARAIRAWGRFKLAAVSSFAFVEAMGPVYAGKLLRDGLGFGKGKGPEAARPRFAPSLDLGARSTMARTVLNAMSLTEGFGRFVLICGHGANVVNNPYASALHCGACGGHSGDVNARLLAGLLNDGEVRTALKADGIDIPADTVFIGGLHDTTTDAITLFDADLAQSIEAKERKQLRRWLAEAGGLARAERALRLPHASASALGRRSRDWSEVRPELGLAGCRAFIAAPRSRTEGRALQGQAFLHDYAWQKDEGFRILELILTAPVVVASWISLQYFGSAVAPSLFGAGNKLLHNVVGGIGVVEGNGGNLRAGLPWQSVHDGVDFVHDPLRLTVAVEAPTEAITDILSRHPQVRALFDQGWLHLLAVDDHGQLSKRYAGNLEWATSEDVRIEARERQKKTG
ncbi:YbcC family protein [Rhizobium sp. SG2393]|uniref:YbcC family protein n=1 Tax=Rhizobium sp. SG2393 TaxID=3276279 RepID=UPI003671E529